MIELSDPELEDSNEVGTAAATKVLNSRNGDFGHPLNPITPFAGGTGPGRWTPNPGTVSMVAPWFGAVRPYGLDSLSRCQPDAPPALTSVEYAEAYNNRERRREPRQSRAVVRHRQHVGRRFVHLFVEREEGLQLLAPGPRHSRR